MNENIELVRKLSFSIQLSDPDDYEGGNLQLLDEGGSNYLVQDREDVSVLFDSRTQHRVLKVTKGTRKSIVGWVVGPVGSEVEHGNDTSELQYQERCNTGSSWTRNIPFENNGYLVCPKLWDPEELACPVPRLQDN